MPNKIALQIITAQPVTVQKSKPEEAKSGEFLQLEVKAAPKPVICCFTPADWAGYIAGVTGGLVVGITGAVAVPMAVNWALAGTLSTGNYIGLGIFSGLPGAGCSIASAGYFAAKRSREIVNAG